MTVYLLHFSRKYKGKQHYIGSTNNLARRRREHGCRKDGGLLHAVKRAGISWRVARVWHGKTVDYEYHLKRGGGKQHCPICNRR